MNLLTAIMLMAALLTLAPVAALCSPSGLGQSVALNKLVTPNGDHRNDAFVFRCYNPRDAVVEARIYDLAGREIAQMRLRSVGTADYFHNYEWDPNAGGHHPGGIYIYQIRLENKVYKGTITVIR